jgi:carboxyl-terminal processing protease
MKKNLFFGLLIALPFLTMAQAKPINAFQQKALLLKRFMDKNHYQPLQWNDTASLTLYNKWINTLDREKLFFTQKDMLALDVYKNKLDDELLGKSWDFFNASTTIFRSRVQKMDSIVQAYLSKPVDFSKPDNFIWPYANFATSEADLTKRWQQYLKWRLLDNIADNITDNGATLTTTLPKDFAKIETKEREAGRKHESEYIKNVLETPQLFTSNMQDGYLNTIAWCYDPHSNYMNVKEKEEFNAQVSAMEFSAGLTIDEDEKGNKLVDFLQPGGSAWLSGQLHKGDVLLKVKAGGIEKEVADISVEELEDILQGNTSGDVEITFKTAAGEIKKTKLLLEKIADDDGKVKSYVLNAGKKIGYINLPGFYSREEDYENLTYDGCANDVSKEIIKLRKDNIDGLILDLRNNGGGSMWEGMQLAGIFIDIGPVASMKDKDGKVSFLKDPNRGTIYDGPLIVLINGRSASASEFLSATLQDYNRALIVGGTTYGKGTAQTVQPLDTNKVDTNKKYEDFVKVTGGKFYRVNGSTVQWKGVEPDIALPDLYGDITFKEKANESALKPDNSKVGNYQAQAALPINMLKVKSEARVKADVFFKAKESFAQFVLQKNKGVTIPLNWASFSQYYTNTKKSYAAFTASDTLTTTNMLAQNNFYDKEGFKLASKQVKETNETYLKEISSDNVLAEACNIFNDWLKK